MESPNVVGVGGGFDDEVHTAAIDSLLSLVSRAHALNAELLRLSRRVSPLVFNSSFHTKYKEVLFDFDYLKAPEHHEDKIERSADLLELSDGLKEEYLTVFKRYFTLFEHLVQYHEDLSQITQDLQKGAYIQSTIDGLLQDREGKQLILEAFSMLGVMLLLLDKEIPAKQRQIVIVSTYRYVGTADIPNFEAICSLCANTAYQGQGQGQAFGVQKMPKGYPASLFARMPIPKEFVSKIVMRLLSEDFYNQLVYFSLEGNHRSRALAHQAAMLFVLLFFREDILEQEFSVMRELFDKHFADNWVVCVYPTLYLDVTTAWYDYKAAQKAMHSVITPERAREVTNRHFQAFARGAKDVEDVLHDGVLNAKKIMDLKSTDRGGEDGKYLEQHAKRITKVVQSCNVSMRWLLLNVFTEHSHSKVVRACVGGIADAARDIVKVLLALVVVENELMQVVRDLVSTKKERWERTQEDIILLLSDLGAFYSGTQVLSRREEVKDEGLQKYFEQMAKHVKKLDMSKPTSCGRKIQQITQALKDVEDFHQLQVSLQTKEYLHRVRRMLVKMTHIASVSDHDVRTCEVAADCSHAFQLFDHLIPHLHRRIAHDSVGNVRDSNSALSLKFLFIKLRSVLDWPLLRISEAESPDLQSVSEFWSGELIKFVTRVTECIPYSMFVKLDDIFVLQTHKLRELPTKLERTQLRNYVFAQDRQSLARVTYSIAMLTEGMMKIETTQLGVEVVEPSVLLEKGVRKQLVRRMTQCLQRELTEFEAKASAGKSSVTSIFSSSSSSLSNRSKVFEDSLVSTRRNLNGIRRSLEYIQDYMQVHGLAIWQEELCKLTKIIVDKELKLRSARTRYQDSRTNIVGLSKFKQLGSDDSEDYLLQAIERELDSSGQRSAKQTFLGSVYDELVLLTNPYESIYSFSLCGWFHSSTGKEEIGLNSFELIRGAVAVSGMHGLDKIVQLEIYNAVRDTSVFLNKLLQHSLRDDVTHLRELMLNRKDARWRAGIEKIVLSLSKSHLLKPMYRKNLPVIGQGQVLRRHIAIELNSNAKLESATYVRSLQCLNRSLIRLERKGNREADQGQSVLESKLLEKVGQHLEYTGQHNPFHKVYHTFVEAKEDDSIAITLLILSCLFASDYVYQKQANSSGNSIVPVKKNKHTPDFVVTTVGLMTILQQLALSTRIEYLELLQQYYRAKLKQACDSEQLAAGTKIGNEVLVLNRFIRLLIQLLGIEGYALPKLLEDATVDIDIELVA